MNQYRVVSGFLLAGLLAAACSCTIEKRLYNKGWYVSSPRHWKGAAYDPETTAIKPEPVIAEPAEQMLVALQTETVDERRPDSRDSYRDRNTLEPMPAPCAVKAVTAKQEAIAEQQLKDVQPSAIQKKTTVKKQRPWSRRTKAATSVMMGTAVLVCTLLAVLCFVTPAIGIADMLAMFVFGVVLALIALAFLFALIGVLFVPSDEKIDENEQKSRNAEKEYEEVSEEERQRIDKERSVRRRDKAAVLIFAGIALLFLALVLKNGS